MNSRRRNLIGSLILLTEHAIMRILNKDTTVKTNEKAVVCELEGQFRENPGAG